MSKLNPTTRYSHNDITLREKLAFEFMKSYISAGCNGMPGNDEILERSFKSADAFIERANNEFPRK